jgi:hypothetical protein
MYQLSVIRPRFQNQKEMILSCNCKSDAHGNPAGASFQDMTYGRGQRVHTKDSKGNATCTVCGNKRSSGGAVEVKVKKS